MGRTGETPLAPVNYIGDFGSGGMMLAFPLMAGILGVRLGRPGQVIDAAMTEGAALLSGMVWHLHNGGYWIDSGARFYEC